MLNPAYLLNPQAILVLSLGELTMLRASAWMHYDGTCKGMVATPEQTHDGKGGLLHQWSRRYEYQNHPVSRPDDHLDGSVRVEASPREMDLLSKVLEVGTQETYPARRALAGEILKAWQATTALRSEVPAHV